MNKVNSTNLIFNKLRHLKQYLYSEMSWESQHYSGHFLKSVSHLRVWKQYKQKIPIDTE